MSINYSWNLEQENNLEKNVSKQPSKWNKELTAFAIKHPLLAAPALLIIGAVCAALMCLPVLLLF
jgi:hypothetical protein